jgi:hypothetical protein
MQSTVPETCRKFDTCAYNGDLVMDPVALRSVAEIATELGRLHG